MSLCKNSFIPNPQIVFTFTKVPNNLTIILAMNPTHALLIILLLCQCHCQPRFLRRWWVRDYYEQDLGLHKPRTPREQDHVWSLIARLCPSKSWHGVIDILRTLRRLRYTHNLMTFSKHDPTAHTHVFVRLQTSLRHHPIPCCQTTTAAVQCPLVLHGCKQTPSHNGCIFSKQS